MIIYTIGFTKKNAETFFSLINKSGADLLLDVRLNANSQLSGFAKKNDLPYFLYKLCNCRYIHADRVAPTKKLLTDYHKGVTSWEEYELIYQKLYQQRDMKNYFLDLVGSKDKVILLCSEATPERCHRRLLAEMLQRDLMNIEVKHL